MAELVLSEITRMAPGFCIIGLEPDGDGFRSVRPRPPAGFAWMPPFEFRRGDKLQFQLSSVAAQRPHVEDCASTGVLGKHGSVSEEDLREMLVRAGTARSVRDLFGCQVRMKRRGAFVIGKLARRSICGVAALRVRLQIDAGELRAAVGLPSGESLPSLPVVDHSWLNFAEAAMETLQGANKGQRLSRYLLERMDREGESGKSYFLRIGLTRPKPNACWLMVDTLFPFPRKSWLNELRDY